MAAFDFFENTPAEREKLFMALYKKAFPVVAKYINKMGGSFEEAKDIFQDALVIYYEKMVSRAIELHANEQAYLLGIAKHLWAKKFKGNIQQVSIDTYDDESGFIEDEDQKASSVKVMHYLETAGQKCMELLRAFYYDKLPINAVAGLFGYSGVHSASVQKYKCLEKVRGTIKEKSLAYEDFIE